jgi:Holliday junction DNA helicase RuvA
MIAHLKGVLTEKAAGRVVVDVSGVGYEVLIPYSTYYELGDAGDTVSLDIYTHVKEDALRLYGFLTSKEKRLFTQLIQISGIGPKLGVAILSGLPVGEFVDAVTDGNVVKLNEIPGVGKKTAERLVLEMKDKVMEWFPELDEAQAGRVSGSLQGDVVSALVNLGYPKHTAERAVARARKEVEADSFEALLRESLRKARK